MPIRVCSFLIFGALLLAHSVAIADHSQIVERYSAQRQTFLELTELLQSGELTTAQKRRGELDGYPLQNHFDYLVLRKQIENSSKPAEFLGQIASLKGDSRLNRRLLGVVKNRSVKLSRWQDYNLAWAHDNAPSHPCDDLLSGFNNGHPKRFSEKSRELWADVSRHTKNCDKAFSMLLDTVPDVPTAALWRRTVALIKRGDLKDVEKLLKYFNSRDVRVVKGWIDGYTKPAAALKSGMLDGNSVHHREVATLLLSKWARKDLPAALDFWRTAASRFGIGKKGTEEAVAKYAVLAAKRSLPEATELLDSAAANQDARYWRVRVALREKDWQRCIETLDDLTEKEQSKTRWQYWRARCLDLQGFRSAAVRSYKSIADEFNYYGFLAADRLSQDYAIETSLPSISESELHQLKDAPRIVKATEYFLVGWPWEGRREWNREIKNASKSKLLAAAQLADSLGWYDRAHKAAVNAGASNALQLLFPEAFESDVSAEADRYNVPHEFVYAVMRQESRFTPDIKSSAGAVGLMQLMPATAKQMGKQLGIKAPVWRLTDSQFNIKLGVKYLDHVLGRFDNNLAHAAAAYNAGPSRVKKWIADRPVATDLWVETIPFDETRGYVQHVLFNTVVSEWLMRDGQVTRLESRMNDLAITQLIDQ